MVVVEDGSGKDVDAVVLLSVAPQQRPQQEAPDSCRQRAKHVVTLNAQTDLSCHVTYIHESLFQ